MIRNLLFDLDGTLTDPAPGITACIRHALIAMGRTPPPAHALTHCIGPPLRASLADLLEVAADSDEAGRALTLYRERFAETGMFENRVYDGIPDLLEDLTQAGRRLFVATSKPTHYARPILAHFALDRYFEAIHGSELDGTRTEKGALLAHILETRGLAAGEAAMIGDRRHDVEGARENGLWAIAVGYGYGTNEELAAAGPDVLCATPADIAPAIRSLTDG